jgi:hypothetical protein
MSKMNFSKTTGLVQFFGDIKSTGLDICESKKSGNKYVVFKTDKEDVITMLAKSVEGINAQNVKELQVSWIEGTNDNGDEVSGYMVHPIGERKVLSSFSLADITAGMGIG